MQNPNLYKIVASVLKIDASTLNESSNATNTENWDSLKHVELILAVESAYGIGFSMAEITGMRNLADMRRILVDKGVNFDASETVRKVA